jgi:glycosyltransferase involved in cell wall biosynthesis
MSNQSMKFLLYLPLDDRTHVSGPVADALNIAQSFASAKIPSILIFNGHPELFRLFEQTGIDVRRMEMPVSSVKRHFDPRYRHRYSVEIADFVKREQIDVLYLLDNAPYLLNYVKNLDLLRVCTQIGGAPNPKPIRLFEKGIEVNPKVVAKAWYRKYVRLNYRKADLVVCLSEAARETALHTYGVSPEKAKTVFPGVTKRASKSNPGAIRQEFGIADQEKLILSVGRITKAKGIEELGEIARILSERGKSYRILFAGRERDQVYGRMIREKYGNYITFIGQRTDLATAYADADLYVHTSHRESGPLTIIEAMEFGVPSIAWDIPGCNELVVDGQTGSLLRFGDLEGFADSIETLLEQHDLYKEASTAANDRFSRFSVDDYAPRIVSAVDDHLAERPVANRR